MEELENVVLEDEGLDLPVQDAFNEDSIEELLEEGVEVDNVHNENE